MSDKDRKKWDGRYTQEGPPLTEPSPLLTELDDILPKRGRALDLAGGAGRHAIFLAKRGLRVTLADISKVGLSVAGDRAAAAGVSIEMLEMDFYTDPFPAGPWDLIVWFRFLHRPLFEIIPRKLAPGGLLVFVHPTHTNLERHAKPSERFLLADGELPGLVKGLDTIHYEQGWLADGQHDVRLVARRPDMKNPARKTEKDSP